MKHKLMWLSGSFLRDMDPVYNPLWDSYSEQEQVNMLFYR